MYGSHSAHERAHETTTRYPGSLTVKLRVSNEQRFRDFILTRCDILSKRFRWSTGLYSMSVRVNRIHLARDIADMIQVQVFIVNDQWLYFNIEASSIYGVACRADIADRPRPTTTRIE